jgi:hypothetical protein
LIDLFQGFIRAGHFPHLHLHGRPGIGKTTAANVLCNALGTDAYAINASLDRGIDMVRNKIIDFASTYSFSAAGKVVILNEADSLTDEAQRGLRAALEEFANNCTVFFISNDPARIIPALQSRCKDIDFTPLSDEAPGLRARYIERLRQILALEGFEHADDGLVDRLVDHHFPDFRRILNELQALALAGTLRTTAKDAPRRAAESRSPAGGVGDTVSGEDTDAGGTNPANSVPGHAPGPIKTGLPIVYVPPNQGPALLDDLAAAFNRHVVLVQKVAEAAALALWTVHAHAHDAAGHSPILGISSPTQRCGKTTLVRILAALTPNPLATSNISPAALYRNIDTDQPTLAVDEADTFLLRNEGMRGILNAGHCRDTASVVRADGTFNVWCPKIIAVIGELPATLADRSIAIRLLRKRPDEQTELLNVQARDGLEQLRERAARFAADNFAVLGTADPRIPQGLDDRAADNWRPLFAIADLAGDRWPGLAREAALLISGNEERRDQTAVLLADIADIFDARKVDRIGSRRLVAELASLDGRPWAEWKNGNPIKPSQLATLLRLHRIGPKTIRFGHRTDKGYILGDFADAFARYIPAHRNKAQKSTR